MNNLHEIPKSQQAEIKPMLHSLFVAVEPQKMWAADTFAASMFTTEAPARLATLGFTYVEVTYNRLEGAPDVIKHVVTLASDLGTGTAQKACIQAVLEYPVQDLPLDLYELFMKAGPVGLTFRVDAEKNVH